MFCYCKENIIVKYVDLTLNANETTTDDNAKEAGGRLGETKHGQKSQ